VVDVQSNEIRQKEIAVFFSVALYVALFIFLAGLAFKVAGWFRYHPFNAPASTPLNRLVQFLKGFAATLLSRKIVHLFRALVLDVLLQVRILRDSPLRWAAHMLICWGFILLLLMHALDHFTVRHLVTPYYHTLNPFLFLRNLFGALILAGMAIAVYRRLFMRKGRLQTNAMDRYLLALLTIVLFSGFFLETLRLTSQTEFDYMVADYAGLDPEADQAEYEALESYWVQEFGLVSTRAQRPFSPETLQEGQSTHQMYCAECHSSYKWAFMSYGTSKLAGGTILQQLDKQAVLSFMWYLHIVSSFIGLAYLPFSKMFHVFASPISLLANAVMQEGKSHPLNGATRQAMELDACTHCGACTLACAVGFAFEELSNLYILPSEKIPAAKNLLRGKDLGEQETAKIINGFYYCVNCRRCTEVCPSGINLQELWFNTRESLLQRNISAYYMLSHLSFFRGLKRDELSKDAYRLPLARLQNHIAGAYKQVERQPEIHLGLLEKDMKNRLLGSLQGSTASACFTCSECSLACPVVSCFDNPKEMLGLLPHQVIRAANLGILNLAFGSNMLWSCLGCYQCQENCPQGVKVTDTFFELKNIAIEFFGRKNDHYQGEKV
jgi:heterodisulfide reductase subunit C/nitrate reductase gamma subunit